MTENSSQTAIKEQDNYDHLATVLLNCVRMNKLSQRALAEIWQYACNASFTEVYKNVLVDAIKEKYNG